MVVQRTREIAEAFSRHQGIHLEKSTVARSPLLADNPVYLKTSRPNPQSQSFSRGYGSILPTSLIYIVLSTRGCTPWRPEAVMSTTVCANKSRHRVFTDRRRRTGRNKNTPLYQTINLIAGQSVSKVYGTVKKKRKLFPGPSTASPISLMLPFIIHVTVREY